MGVSVTTLGRSETGGEGSGSTGGGIGIVLFKMVAICRMMAVRVSSLIGRSGDDVLGAFRIDRMSVQIYYGTILSSWLSVAVTYLEVNNRPVTRQDACDFAIFASAISNRNSPCAEVASISIPGFFNMAYRILV